MKNKIAAGGIVVLLAGLDQWTKKLAVLYLKDNEPFVIIKNVFELSYLENRGAAFGIFQNHGWIFLVTTLIIMAALLWAYQRILEGTHYLPLRLCAIFCFAGALGNMIDRIALGYVVDFFYFRLIDFPVFNVADIYVTLSVFSGILLTLFFYQDEELEMILKKKKGN